jgi:Flp pilus assembly protein TadB
MEVHAIGLARRRASQDSTSLPESDFGYQPGKQRPEGDGGEQMSPLLWILIAVLVIAAIAGGITISPFLLILIVLAILIYVLVMRDGRTTRY